MISVHDRFVVPMEKIKKFCKNNYIKKLSIFGSILREDFHDDSDIDILVVFDSNHLPTLFELADMEARLSSLLQGRKVDLRTLEDLSRYFRNEILDVSEVLYVE